MGDDKRTLLRWPVTIDRLAALRDVAIRTARHAGLDIERAQHFALAVNEVATNTIVHAGGSGQVTIVQDDNRQLFADISDSGSGLTGPGLTGPEDIPLPPAERVGGRGLWLVRQLCDAVQIRSTGRGTVVRLGMTLG